MVLAAAGHESAEESLRQVDAALGRGEWSAAEKAARGLLEQALQRQGDIALADAVARIALAEAGQDRTEDALWDWTIAQTLGTDFDPRPIGAPGALLAKSPLRHWDEVPASLAVRRPDDGLGPLSPAERQAGKNPEIPLLWRAYPKGIRVQGIVDEQGRLQQPVVADSTFPALTYVILDALRGWRFSPAKAGDRPVAAFYQLEIPGGKRALADLVDFKNSPLAEPEALLRSGRYEEAGKQVGKVWRSSLNVAEQIRGFLGVALALESLAEAGRGDEEGAICRWQAAQTLEPRLYGADLAAYGKAGVLLDRHPWGEGNRQTMKIRLEKAQEKAGAVPAGQEKVKRPEILKRRQPEYPDFARDLGVQGKVVVETVITQTGTVRNTILLTSTSSPSLEASALDAVCDWRFQPATFRGEPVPVYYSLTLKFEIGSRSWDSRRGRATGSP
jgi:TonB family protein